MFLSAIMTGRALFANHALARGFYDINGEPHLGFFYDNGLFILLVNLFYAFHVKLSLMILFSKAN